MVTFWRPVRSEAIDSHFHGRMKKLGNGLYALWARCDLCQRSGSFETFVLWERDREVGTLCHDCDSQPGIWRELQADGWKRC